MNKIRKGDQVIVLAGKDKGRKSHILKMLSESNRAIVENVNVAKKHVKANPQKGVQGGILDKEMPIHISNLALVNPESGKADRVGFKHLEDGSKVRFFKSTGEVVDS